MESATRPKTFGIESASRDTLLPQRNFAVDAYRGLVMVLMMGEVLRFAEVARAHPDSSFWRILAYNQTHPEWHCLIRSEAGNAKERASDTCCGTRCGGALY
jgi:hypothetical protein